MNMIELHKNKYAININIYRNIRNNAYNFALVICNLIS